MPLRLKGSRWRSAVTAVAFNARCEDVLLLCTERHAAWVKKRNTLRAEEEGTARGAADAAAPELDRLLQLHTTCSEAAQGCIAELSGLWGDISAATVGFRLMIKILSLAPNSVGVTLRVVGAGRVSLKTLQAHGTASQEVALGALSVIAAVYRCDVSACADAVRGPEEYAPMVRPTHLCDEALELEAAKIIVMAMQTWPSLEARKRTPVDL